MSDQVFKYRGQIGSIEFDTEDDCLHGRLLHINDLVTYEAESMGELRKEFYAAVDDYLETCRELGQEPNKPFKGSFNVRVGSDLHRKIAFKAIEKGVSLNDAVVQAVSDYVTGAPHKQLMDDVGAQIRKHVYQASLYASDVRKVSEPRPSAKTWSDTFEGLRRTYSIKPEHDYEH